MKTTSGKMALKPYLEAVREHCETLSKEELIESMIELAQEASVGERSVFLDKIRAFAPASAAGSSKARPDFSEALLERIARLREEIEERIRSIEAGDYWEEPEHWDYGGYDDEQPDYVTTEQAEELENLFLETGSLFLEGRLDTACRLYAALFQPFHEDEDLLPGYLDSVDVREEKARYCRCVYETSDPKTRLEAFFDCMDVNAAMDDDRLELTSEPSPMLRDIIDSRPGQMPHWESFLPAWAKRLASCHTDRAAMLCIEAVQMIEGIDGVSWLAKQWGSGQPRGYLFWIQCLEGEGDWNAMLDVCRETLDILPKCDFREQTARYLTRAATELGKPEYVLLGKRERFLSVPRERNLIALLDEAEKQNVRSRELDAVLASIKDIKKNQMASEDLLVKMLLMAGRVREAFEEGHLERSIGWSYGRAGVLFACILSVLTGNSPRASVIRALLKEYSARHDAYGHDDGEVGAKDFCTELLRGLESVKIAESEAKKYATWADRIGRDRVEAIVSEKHRGAYARAARVLGALTEFYVLSGERDKAVSLLHEFVFEKFPRHRAFRAEVKSVAAGSPLVKDLRVI
jgi:hypothetical protein